MEKIMVFTGMEVHGTVEMTVLKTFTNGVKLCWFDHKTDDEDGSWDELWLVQNSPFDYNYGGTEWYGIDSKNIRVDFDVRRWLNKEYNAMFINIAR